MPGASCATCASGCRVGVKRITKTAHLVNLGGVDYREAFAVQRSLAAAVAEGSAPDTVLLLVHPPTITLGRRTEEGEVHVAGVAQGGVVEGDRGGESTYPVLAQAVC